MLGRRQHQVVRLCCPAAGFHCAAISRHGSEERWPPGPDSPVGSLSGHPAVACMPGRLR